VIGVIKIELLFMILMPVAILSTTLFVHFWRQARLLLRIQGEKNELELEIQIKDERIRRLELERGGASVV
jgi:hypothetical protein